MAQIVVNAIVIRYVNYKDNDRMLTLFSRERGRIDACARGCRRPKSQLLACSQPFVFGEFTINLSPNSASVYRADIIESFYPLREDVGKLCAASAIIQFLRQTIQENEPNEELFSLVYHALSFLGYSDINPIDCTLGFILRFLSALGLRPYITECAICNKSLLKEQVLRFNPRDGGALCDDCAKVGLKLSPLTAEAMRKILLMDDAGMVNIKLPEYVQKELLTILRAYCDCYLEGSEKAFSMLKL